MLQGLAKGSNIPPSGQRQISWYPGLSTSTPPTGATMAPPKTTPDLNNDEAYSRDHSSLHTPNDEEPAVSGWGSYEDEDGMGML